MSDTYPRDLIGYGANPPNPRWPNGARLALNLVLNYEEGSEYSVPDGDGCSEATLTELGTFPSGIKGRDLAAEGMFEYGSRVGFWRILRILQERNLPMTVFGCALALERHPPAAAAIKAAGYDVCCHGWRWINHYQLDEPTERQHIAKAIDSLKASVGERPLGWYCRYGPGLNTRRLVAEEGGFLYDSDCYNDELPYWTQVAGKPHLVVPYTVANNDAKFPLGSIGTGGQFFEMLRDAFDLMYREGRTRPAMMSVGLHNRITGQPMRAVGLERFLDHVMAHQGVWITRRIDIARHWMAVHPYKK